MPHTWFQFQQKQNCLRPPYPWTCFPEMTPAVSDSFHSIPQSPDQHFQPATVPQTALPALLYSLSQQWLSRYTRKASWYSFVPAPSLPAQGPAGDVPWPACISAYQSYRCFWHAFGHPRRQDAHLWHSPPRTCRFCAFL